MALAGLIALALILSGCPSRGDALDLAYALPDVQEFLAQNPEAGVKAIYLSQDDVSADIDSIREKCGQQMEEVPYYYVTITQDDQTIEVYTDSDATRVLCLIKPSTADDGTDGGDFPDGDGGDALDPIQLAEEKFEETVCNAIPNNAVHAASGDVTVLIPVGMDDELKAMGDNILFNTYSISTNAATGERYCDGRWAYGGGQGSYVMVVPITADLADDTGNKIATEAGGIKLAFEGPLEPLKIKSITPDTVPTRPPTPIQYPLFPSNNPPCPSGNTCVYEPVPTFTRTDCMVDFEHSCPEEEGYSLAGQCHYSDFVGDLADDWRVVDNLGKCRYCPTGSRGDWSVLGICGMGFNCIGGSGNGGNGGQQTYFTSCSSCQYGQRSYNYNGNDYATCNYYYNLCVANDCADKRTNCAN